MSKEALINALIDIFWLSTTDDKVMTKSLFTVECEEDLPEELIPYFQKMETFYEGISVDEPSFWMNEYANTLENLNPFYFSLCKDQYHRYSRPGYQKVCTIEEWEFGYYHIPCELAALDQYQCVAIDHKTKEQRILAYEDSPGEATETIARYIKNGFSLFSIEFQGGYRLNYDNGAYWPVLIE